MIYFSRIYFSKSVRLVKTENNKIKAKGPDGAGEMIPLLFAQVPVKARPGYGSANVRNTHGKGSDEGNQWV